MNKGYVLLTADYNEENYIAQTIQAVVAQRVQPVRWIMVSVGCGDGTDDITDAIVQHYATRYPFLVLHRITERHERNFGAQVAAINAGYEKMKLLDFDFLGNVDADIQLPPNYYETLLHKFGDDPSL